MSAESEARRRELQAAGCTCPICTAELNAIIGGGAATERRDLTWAALSVAGLAFAAAAVVRVLS